LPIKIVCFEKENEIGYDIKEKFDGGAEEHNMV